MVDDANAGGVYFDTNPDREHKRYLFPEPTRRLLFACSPDGLRKSDPAYLDHVLMVICDWRRARDVREWFCDVYDVLVDTSTRRYPTWFASTEDLISMPEETITLIASWLDIDFSIDVALKKLKTATSSFAAKTQTSNWETTLDHLVKILSQRGELSEEFVEELGALYVEFSSEIKASPTKERTTRNS